MNASTSYDETEYHYSLPENRLELWAYLESERFLHPVMREFYKERNVVIEERRMRTDSNPIGRLVEQFTEAAFTAHPYHRPTVGWMSDLNSFSATDAQKFFDKYYVPSNMVVAVAGDIKAAEAMPILEKYFSRLPARPQPDERTTTEPPQDSERKVVLKEHAQPLYLEGYHRPDYRSKDDAVFDAITDLMSEGRTSRLYRALVRDKKIASFSAGFTGMPGTKYPHLFAFYAFPLPGHTTQEVADAIHVEIDKLKKEDITDDELKMIKTRSKANLIRGLADNEGLATQLAIYQTRYGDWRELFKSVDRIDQVSKADIRRIANADFRRHQPHRRHYRKRRRRCRRRPATLRRLRPGRCAMTSLAIEMRATKMKLTRTFLLILLAATATLTTVPRAAAQATSWQQVPIPPLPAFKPQQPKRIELANGMVIFLQEDHELPLIDGTARIRGGSVNEPAAKAGLMDIYGEVWRTGGTKSQTGDELDDFLEVRAAKVETGSSSDSTSISFSCLKADLDDVFKVFTDVLQHPEFRADKIDIAQKEEGDGISRRNDQVSEIASRETVKLAYGADNPYARVPEYATIAAITRQDLIDWHGKYVHPNNIILGISGDFDSKAMEARLRAAFDAWPKGPAAPKNEIKFTPAKPGYYLVPKDDVNQSTIHMIGLGTTRDNPDYYAISVFNEAFGGGFSSRLFNDIRTQRGLAYGVSGGIGTNFGHPGILQSFDWHQERKHGRSD